MEMQLYGDLKINVATLNTDACQYRHSVILNDIYQMRRPRRQDFKRIRWSCLRIVVLSSALGKQSHACGDQDF